MNLAMTITLAEHIKAKELTVEKRYPDVPWTYDENMVMRHMGPRRPEITVTFLVSRHHLSLLKEQAKSHKISVMVDNIPREYKHLLNGRVIGYASMNIYSLHIDEYRNDGNVSVIVECLDIDISVVSGGE